MGIECKQTTLKGQCYEIFCLQFFHESTRYGLLSHTLIFFRTQFVVRVDSVLILSQEDNFCCINIREIFIFIIFIYTVHGLNHRFLLCTVTELSKVMLLRISGV
jgi:hypothetical protein